MAIKVALEHRTTYHFDRLVEVHPHVVRLRPAAHSRTKIDAYSLTVEPAGHFINWQQDAYGNYLARLVFPERTRKLEITVGLIADMAVINPFDFFIEDWAEYIGFDYPADLHAELAPYLVPVDEEGSGSGPGALVQGWAKEFAGDRTETGWSNFPPGTRTISFLVALIDALRTDVTYSIRMEAGVQTPDHTLRSAVGSCRDSAWLLVSVLRELGLAARFVSGYLVQLAADVEALDGPSGPAADFTDLHAWTEVFLPGAGWVGLDPTSGLFAGEGHIPLSATPHPASAAAITGATGKCKATMDYANIVRRVHEDPRVTLPYTAQQWDRVVALGAALDEQMAAADIRLTVGGEPTFVSIDNQTDPEWQTAADGPHKRERASDLAARLKSIYAPTGLVQRSQGKWYPGEPLPRWQIGLIWREDGEAVWSDPALLADPWDPDAENDPADHTVAKALIAHVAGGLKLPDSQVRPFFEDPLARLATFVRSPDGPPVDASDDLGPVADTGAARAALLARLEETVNEPSGYLLPLHRFPGDSTWSSADWQLRRGRIVLLEGDSPAGLRLPLGSVSWVAPPVAIPADPIAPKLQFGPRGPLDEKAAVASADATPTTALLAEIRDGLLYVFLPPIEEAENFLDLVARVEAAAAALDQPVVIEGYGPPSDERLANLTVTPDPGVIEVNVQPTESFAEQAELLEILYEQARLARLGTESFDIDGSHRGTGGGNHITLGGRTPRQSPLLRRPDLLVSMLTYWQRHPSLSYLFSGQFIGTTSQAPRVDEGRETALYELEIAFAEILRQSARASEGKGGGGVGSAPWVVDRALRHLLTDITGNTHRAEFCIDKLYSPDSARGRLGLLELRGFEMPPHFQMAMVQSLLVRSLVTRFWDEPFRAPLIRHGANLHGRYLLPHFIISDIARVAEDLRAHDIEFDTAWLDPFTEFRFPRIGTAVFDDVEIELRGAIEPWNTLGEESSATGTARYVDSSVERLQVRLVGADRGRYVLTCNGYPVPMLATDNSDIQVAGVRFRAWQPPSALHPTITVDGPLTFDLVDAHTGLSRGGCTYHISHPGGLSHEILPVNAVEAESRRNRRFEATGHTPGVIDLADLRERSARLCADAGAPGLLDLRRVRTVLSR